MPSLAEDRYEEVVEGAAICLERIDQMPLFERARAVAAAIRFHQTLSRFWTATGTTDLVAMATTGEREDCLESVGEIAGQQGALDALMERARALLIDVRQQISFLENGGASIGMNEDTLRRTEAELEGLVN